MSLFKRHEPQARTPFAIALFDVLCGFVSFAAVMFVSYFYQDIRPFLLATCLAFFAAGFYRSGLPQRSLFRTALFVALGGILPAVIMNRLGAALTSMPFFVLFMLGSSMDIVLGIFLRSLISREKAKFALVLASIWTLSLFAVVYKALPDWMDSRAYVTTNREVTPFRIQTLAGKVLTSEEWKGRVVVLSFWASWCSPCNAELPEIQAVQDRYRGNPGVLVFALDSGTGGDTSARAQAYLDAKKLSLTATIDSLHTNDDSWGPAAKSLGTHGIPTVYILDRSGRLRAIHLGYDSSEHLTKTLSRQIDQLL